MHCGCLLGLLVVLACAVGCRGPTSGFSAAPGGSGSGGASLGFGAANDQDCNVLLAGEGGASDPGDAGCESGVSVDYTTQVAPILGRCTGEVCHDFAAPRALIAFIGVPADECCARRVLIAPGHPEQSYLMDKLEGRRLCFGARMPLDRAPLAEPELAILREWICQGATTAD